MTTNALVHSGATAHDLFTGATLFGPIWETTGARSKASYDSDCRFQFSVQSFGMTADRGVIVGLNTTDSGPNPADIQHGVMIQGSFIWVIERGVIRSTTFTLPPGTVTIYISRVADKVYYSVGLDGDGKVLVLDDVTVPGAFSVYAQDNLPDTPSIGTVFLDCVMAGQGTTIFNASGLSLRGVLEGNFQITFSTWLAFLNGSAKYGVGAGDSVQYGFEYDEPSATFWLISEGARVGPGEYMPVGRAEPADYTLTRYEGRVWFSHIGDARVWPTVNTNNGVDPTLNYFDPAYGDIPATVGYRKQVTLLGAVTDSPVPPYDLWGYSLGVGGGVSTGPVQIVPVPESVLPWPNSAYGVFADGFTRFGWDFLPPSGSLFAALRSLYFRALPPAAALASGEPTVVDHDFYVGFAVGEVVDGARMGVGAPDAIQFGFEMKRTSARWAGYGELRFIDNSVVHAQTLPLDIHAAGNYAVARYNGRIWFYGPTQFGTYSGGYGIPGSNATLDGIYVVEDTPPFAFMALAASGTASTGPLTVYPAAPAGSTVQFDRLVTAQGLAMDGITLSEPIAAPWGVWGYVLNPLAPKAHFVATAFLGMRDQWTGIFDANSYSGSGGTTHSAILQMPWGTDGVVDLSIEPFLTVVSAGDDAAFVSMSLAPLVVDAGPVATGTVDISLLTLSVSSSEPTRPDGIYASFPPMEATISPAKGMGTVDVMFPPFEVYAYKDDYGVASVAFEPLSSTAFGVATYGYAAALTAPKAVATGYGGGYADLTAPHLSVRSNLGAAARASPRMGRIYSAGHNSTGENAAALTAPRPTLTATGGANAKLTAPRSVMGITGTFTNAARAALTAPSPALDASGTVSETGSFSPYIGSPMATLIGYGGAVSAVSAPMPRLQISGTLGGIASVAMVCPLFELTAGGHAENRGSAHLIAPMPGLGATIQTYMMAPMAKLMAIGSAVVEVTYEAYAVNLNHPPSRVGQASHPDEVTRYTNFPFTQIVRYQNSYFGVSAAGLYLLEGVTDNGAPINASIETHKTDFGKPELKAVVAAYFGGRKGPAENISLLVGESSVKVHAFTTPRGSKEQTYRQKFGLGNRDHYYAVAATGNGPFELESIEFELATTKRKI